MKILTESKKIKYYLTNPMLSDEEQLDNIGKALHYFEFYINLATIQMDRILSDKKQLQYFDNNNRASIENKVIVTKFFGDIYFCICSLDKAYKLAEKISDEYTDLQLREITDEYKHLNKYRKVRNAIEHTEEKIFETDWFSQQIGSFTNDMFSLNGTNFHVSHNTLLPFYNMYQKIIRRLDELIKDRKEKVDALEILHNRPNRS
ncbi:hypothetical protein [Brevibacillus sp. VP]|uniref:hypothetical protein n=1 Tax=unclassified Brevibacillus TaxID=2684853 RepID=UPI000E2EB2C5|nr:hypothetical protein [Brevibacillus sp. VP]RFB35686.1 hypothetical protein DZB91_09330 [Brevibacillus sp. VP]